jgi:hypothetical protein
MSRLLALLGACTLMSLAFAASASAESISVSAQPAAPSSGTSQQDITVSTVADAPSYIAVASYEAGTSCPASYTYGAGNGAMNDGDEYTTSVPQGSSTTQVRVKFARGTVSHSHLCGYLNAQAGTIGTDSPLKRWGDVAGFNLRSTSYYVNGNRPASAAFRFIFHCSEGTSGLTTDGDCPMAGQVRITISSKLRKKLHLKSATLLKQTFKAIDRGRGLRVDYAAGKTFAKKVRAADLGKLPATVTLTSSAPLTKTASGQGNLMNYVSGLSAATYHVEDNEGE